MLIGIHRRFWISGWQKESSRSGNRGLRAAPPPTTAPLVPGMCYPGLVCRLTFGLAYLCPVVAGDGRSPTYLFRAAKLAIQRGPSGLSLGTYLVIGLVRVPSIPVDL